MEYDEPSWSVILLPVLAMIPCETLDFVGGEVPRLVAVEGTIEEDGRFVKTCSFINR